MRCTLDKVVEVVAEHAIRPPAVVVIGKVVDRAPELSWFAARPLSSTRVLVAGSPATSERLRARLSALGAHVFLEPAIRITDPPDWAPVDAALDGLEQYDWLTFSSANGVDYFFHRLTEKGGDARRLGQIKLAAVGSNIVPETLTEQIRVLSQPDQFSLDIPTEPIRLGQKLLDS